MHGSFPSQPLGTRGDSPPHSQYYRETSLLIEYKNLKYLAPSGVYVMPSYDSLCVWHGMVFVRQGPYREGIFKFRIDIPDTYPRQCPKVTFISRLFHPRVSPSGELDVSSALPTWSPQKDYVVHLLTEIQKAFNEISVESPANPTAATMYMEAREEFQKEVDRCVQESNDKVLFTEPGNSFKVMPYNKRHEELRQQILNGEIKREAIVRLQVDVGESALK